MTPHPLLSLPAPVAQLCLPGPSVQSSQKTKTPYWERKPRDYRFTQTASFEKAVLAAYAALRQAGDPDPGDATVAARVGRSHSAVRDLRRRLTKEGRWPGPVRRPAAYTAADRAALLALAREHATLNCRKLAELYGRRRGRSLPATVVVAWLEQDQYERVLELARRDPAMPAREVGRQVARDTGRPVEDVQALFWVREARGGPRTGTGPATDRKVLAARIAATNDSRRRDAYPRDYLRRMPPDALRTLHVDELVEIEYPQLRHLSQSQLRALAALAPDRLRHMAPGAALSALAVRAAPRLRPTAAPAAAMP